MPSQEKAWRQSSSRDAGTFLYALTRSHFHMRALGPQSMTEYQKSFEVDILIFSWASLSMASFSEAPEGALRFIMTLTLFFCLTAIMELKCEWGKGGEWKGPAT